MKRITALILSLLLIISLSACANQSASNNDSTVSPTETVISNDWATNEEYKFNIDENVKNIILLIIVVIFFLTGYHRCGENQEKLLLRCLRPEQKMYINHFNTCRKRTDRSGCWL